MSLENFRVRTPCVVRAAASLVEVWRQRPTASIWQGEEVYLAARRPWRTRKVIARSASFSFSLLLVSSSIVLVEDRPAQRDRCASAAAPPLLRLAAPLSPPARLARPFNHLPRPPWASRREAHFPSLSNALCRSLAPHLHQGGGYTHHTRRVHTETLSDTGISSLVIFLLRWGSGGARGRWT